MDADSLLALCTLCEILLGLDRHDEVIEAAERAIRIDPTREYPYWLKGQALRRSGRLFDAIESYRLAAERAPDKFMVCLSFAGALHQAGRFAEARDAYLQALRVRPHDERVLKRLGDVERQLKRQTTSQPYASGPA
jgi:tetratricopeptide (TPR) repeat protein